MAYDYLDAAELATIIRRDLKAVFPTVKFSVRSSKYSMGSSVNVRWTDGPTIKAVDAVVDRYKAQGFDGMTDSTTNSGHGYTPCRCDLRCKYGHVHATPEGAKACQHAENMLASDAAVAPRLGQEWVARITSSPADDVPVMGHIGQREAIFDVAEMLWTVVANVSRGDWTQQSQEWQDAAARWRNAYFELAGARNVSDTIKSDLSTVIRRWAQTNSAAIEHSAEKPKRGWRCPDCNHVNKHEASWCRNCRALSPPDHSI